MKEKDLEKKHDDIIESPEKLRRFDVPLSANCRCMLFFHGEPNKGSFDRLHEYVTLMELSILGGKRPVADNFIKQEIETGAVPANLVPFVSSKPGQHIDANGETRNQRKARLNKEKRQAKRNAACEKHPTSPKNEFNHRCVECLREQGHHMQKAREAKLLAKHGVIVSSENGNGAIQ